MGTRDQELLQQLNLEPLWMPFTANRQFKAAAAPAGGGQGHVLHRP